MVRLSDWKEYWNSIVTRIPSLKGVHFVTEEADIKDKVLDIGKKEMPFLLVVTPSAKSSGEQDSFRENNLCLTYILSKEDAYSYTTFEMQEILQPIMEDVKEMMINDKEGCGIMRDLDLSTLHTDPEKKLFTKLTGWSLSFTI